MDTMNLIPTADPTWVGCTEHLRSMLDDLRRYKRLAVDTESNSLHAYKEQVCLIQFSTGENDYLVDPLSIKDLSSLGTIFADAQIEKIFHAAEYDIICLKRDYGFEFRNLFDTMLASRTLGRAEIGLAALIEAEFGVRLDKRYQRANWGKRPLPIEWQAYARLDTFYLLPLRERLKNELFTRGRLEMAEEDFVRMCNVLPNGEGNGHNPCWRIGKSRYLNPQEVTLLNELCAFREEQARLGNVPPFKVMGNDTLLHLAVHPPQTIEEIAATRGIGRWLVKNHGADLLEVIKRGLSSPPIQPPPSPPRPSEVYLSRLEALRSWRKKTGEKIGVPSDVILPRDIMEAIARANPAQQGELAVVMKDIPWRFNHFGVEILSVIQK